MLKRRTKITIYSDDPRNPVEEVETSMTSDGCSTILVIAVIIAVGVAMLVGGDENYSSSNVQVCSKNIWGHLRV